MMSSCHCVTVSLCHRVMTIPLPVSTATVQSGVSRVGAGIVPGVSLCHCVTMSLCHRVMTISLPVSIATVQPDVSRVGAGIVPGVLISLCHNNHHCAIIIITEHDVIVSLCHRVMTISLPVSTATILPDVSRIGAGIFPGVS